MHTLAQRYIDERELSHCVLAASWMSALDLSAGMWRGAERAISCNIMPTSGRSLLARWR